MIYNAQSDQTAGGVGKHRTKKMRIFFVIGWKIGVFAFIVMVLLFGWSGRAAEVTEATAKPPESEVWVDVRLKGAERLDEILALRKRVAELEASERRSRAENAVLAAERNLLKQELFDVVNQLESQNAEFRRLELSVAGLSAAGKIPGASAREDRLTEAIGEITKNGRELAVLAVEFCNEVDAIAKSLPDGNLEGVRLRLKIDELRSASRKFSTLSEWRLTAEPVERCRLLSVNVALGIVVLPVGSVHGVFNGLNFYVPGKTPAAVPVRLRVFSTRALVAAAVVTDGDIRTLSPGSEAVTDLQKTINREQ